MTNAEDPDLNEFISSGRAGRRNALPDILDANHANTSTGGLPDDLSKLRCSGWCHSIHLHLWP